MRFEFSGYLPPLRRPAPAYENQICESLSSVLTQCPNCQTTFRVTSEILRVAHGQVRCGRCHTQFDALERLIEEAPAGPVESGRLLKPSEAQIEVEEPATQEDIT